MNAFGLSFLVVGTVLTLSVPRRWVALPLLMSVCYMPDSQVIELAGANFTVPRLIIAAALMRILLRGERIGGGWQAVDTAVLAWAVTLAVTTVAHLEDTWMWRFGMLWTELGAYLVLRFAMHGADEVRDLLRTLLLVALPLAALMLVEKLTGTNPFAFLGAANALALVRDGQLRASGPFAHPILAGGAGTALIGFAIAIWASDRRRAILGVIAGAALVFASASSGPILVVLFIVLGNLAWLVRRQMWAVRTAAIVALAGLAAFMQAPIYFLLARVDVLGSSEGWFRAQLIDSAFDHLSEWWLAGTDYTRHWMGTGIMANARHTDMTNHILTMGVLGGLPLVFLFLTVLYVSYRSVGLALGRMDQAPRGSQWLVWALGALLFGFTMEFLSITLFDQTVIFFWLTIASIAALRLGAAAEAVADSSMSAQVGSASMPSAQLDRP